MAEVLEEWRDVPGWPARYQVSNHGNVRSFRAGKWKVMSPGRGTKYGHRKVLLGRDKEGHWVHRLVLRTFVGEPIPGDVARHIDGNPENNRLENLAWGTPAENNRDMVRHGRSGRGERSASAKLTEQDVRLIRSLRGWVSAARLGRVFGVTPTTISQVWNGRSWGWLDA